MNAPLTETLDRIAQSHIEGRVRPVVRAAVKVAVPPFEMDGPIRCRLCGVDYTREYHAASCPTQRRKQ